MKYETFWRNKWITSDAKSVEDMISRLSSAVEELRIINDAVKLGKIEAEFGNASDDYIWFQTEDKDLADQLKMSEMEEYDDE